MFPHLMSHLSIDRDGPGRLRTRPDRVRGDKAYSSRAIRTQLRERGITAVIPEPGRPDRTPQTTRLRRRPATGLRQRGLQRPQRRRSELQHLQAMARPGHPLRQTRTHLPRRHGPAGSHHLAGRFRRHALARPHHRLWTAFCLTIPDRTNSSRTSFCSSARERPKDPNTVKYPAEPRSRISYIRRIGPSDATGVSNRPRLAAGNGALADDIAPAGPRQNMTLAPDAVRV